MIGVGLYVKSGSDDVKKSGSDDAGDREQGEKEGLGEGTLLRNSSSLQSLLLLVRGALLLGVVEVVMEVVGGGG